MPGCNKCKHHQSEIIFTPEGRLASMERKCQLGNTEAMVNWWDVNGKQKPSEQLTNLNCHEYHESTLILKSMLDNLEEIKQRLK